MRISAMKPHQDPTDADLLQSMLDGDEEALAVLYQRRQRGLYRFGWQMSGSQSLAEDVTQEVFIVLIRDGHTFNPGRGSLEAFLMGVARNLLLRRLQRERFYAPLNDDAGEESGSRESLVTTSGPLEDFSRAEAVTTVRTAVLALPVRYREVVVLCDLQEMSYLEAAEILGCAVGTIRSRLHRARALLMDKLRPVSAEEPAASTKQSQRGVLHELSKLSNHSSRPGQWPAD